MKKAHLYLLLSLSLWLASTLHADPLREVLIVEANSERVLHTLKGIIEEEEGAIEVTGLAGPFARYSTVEIIKKEGLPADLFKRLIAALGGPKHYLHPLKGARRLTRLKANQIAFRLDNDKNILNPLGLAPVTLPARSGSLETHMDIHIGDRLIALVSTCREIGLPLYFTSAFRPAPKQWQLYRHKAENPYPVAEPGQSHHEAGFAFDIEIGHWSNPQYRNFTMLAEAFGFETIPGDPIHFQADPADFGYWGLKSAIQKNQIDYYRQQSPSDFKKVPSQNWSDGQVQADISPTGMLAQELK